jgi:hypothetical protein
MFIKNLFKELDAKLKGRQVKKFANLPGGRQDGALNGK